MQDLTIITAGEALVEFFFSNEVDPGTHSGIHLGPFPSGAPAIFIDQASKLGAKAKFIGGIGDDHFGQIIKAKLHGDLVNVEDLQVIKDKSTGVAFVSYRNDGERDFIFHVTDTAADSFEPSISSLDSSNVVLHISGSTLGVPKLHNIIKSLIEMVRIKSGKISFDPNIRPELMHEPNVTESISEIIKLCDTFMPSESDLRYLYPSQDPAEAIRKLIKSSPKVVAYKQGAAGATIFADGIEHNLRGHQIQEVDPTGAGDCFCGAFITLYYSGFSAEKAGEYANAAGALASTKLGPMEGNPTLAEIEDLLDRETGKRTSAFRP